MDIRILGGGAANSLVASLAVTLKSATGGDIRGDYGAVGGMRDRVRAGEAVDLVILTRSLIDELAADGLVCQDTIRDVGRVATSVAVKCGVSPPDVGSEFALRTALLAADAIYFPDPKAATAGIHFANVLDQLGISDTVSDRLRTFPNGQTAMAAMAGAGGARAIGCTQKTEILNTPGVVLVGDLPAGFALTAMYTAAVARNAANTVAARTLIDLMTDPSSSALRSGKGFST